VFWKFDALTTTMTQIESIFGLLFFAIGITAGLY